GLDAEAGVVEEGMAVPGPWTDVADQSGEEAATNAPETQPTLRRAPERAASGDDAPPTNAAIYFRDISATTLLTAEEEIELARLIEDGEDCKRALKNADAVPEHDRDRLEDLVTQG